MDSVAGIAITSFLVGLSGAMMPGPVLTVTIGETGARLREGPSLDRDRIGHATAGWRAQAHGALAGPLVVVGHGLLEVLLVAGVVLGLGRLLVLGPVIGTVGLLGGAVLLLGFGLYFGYAGARYLLA